MRAPKPANVGFGKLQKTYLNRIIVFFYMTRTLNDLSKVVHSFVFIGTPDQKCDKDKHMPNMVIFSFGTPSKLFASTL